MQTLSEPIILDPITQKNMESWLEGQYDDETKTKIKELLETDLKQLIDSFYTTLTFGTGGLRGLIGVGTNRMNIYTVRAATQGLANYIRQHCQNEEPAVIIGYDSRHYSREFAEESAKVLAGNVIQVYLLKELRPTPLVSFGCRYKKCHAAIMITASHNPPEYNGYKVYWTDGGQIVPPHDQAIIREIKKIIDPTQVKAVETLSHQLIDEVLTEVDEAYIDALVKLQHYQNENLKEGHRLKIVYTSLHGAGITLVPQALKAWGFSTLTFVASQIKPDGAFPTVSSPNPEEASALQMGVDELLKTNSDILIATDPDADRMGIAVRHQNEAVLLNGNQISVLCLEHICKALTTQHRLPTRAVFVKTIGTTELFQAICAEYHVPCINVLTGFKYIAEKIAEWEKNPNGYEYIFGGEESYGYLLGTDARDKDAVSSSALISEVALQAKLEGKTLIDKLYELYRKHGIYQEQLLSLHFSETKEGKEQMVRSMDCLRCSQLKEINEVSVVTMEDYLLSTKLHLKTGKTERLTLPLSDVIVYWLEDGTKVMIRPSGTEPRIKLYCGAAEKSFSSIEEGIALCQIRCHSVLMFFKNYLI